MKRTGVASFLLVLALAAGLRVWHLRSGARDCLWGDEVQELGIVATSASVGEMLERVRRDGHPPLEYLIVYASGLRDPEALRAFPLVFGVAMVAVLMALARRRFGPTCGLLTGVLAASAPYFIHYATENRVYSLFGLLVVVHAAALLRFLDRPGLGRAALWGAAAALLAYSHYYAFHTILAGGLYALLRERTRRNLLLVVAAGATFLLLFAPWLGSFLRQIGQDLQAWYRPTRDPRRMLDLFMVVLGRRIWPVAIWFLWRGVVRARRGDAAPGGSTAFFALFWMAIGATLSAWLAQQVTSPFLDRYLIGNAALLLPCMGFAWAPMLEGRRESIRLPWRREPLVVAGRPRSIVAATLLALVLISQWEHRPSWVRRVSPACELARFVEANERPGDWIWLSRAFAGLAFHHAYRGNLELVTPPYEERLAYLDWMSLRERLGDEALKKEWIRRLERRLDAGGRVWFLAEGSYPATREWVFEEPPDPEEAPLAALSLAYHRAALKTLYERADIVLWRSPGTRFWHRPLVLILFDPTGR